MPLRIPSRYLQKNVSATCPSLSAPTQTQVPFRPDTGNRIKGTVSQIRNQNSPSLQRLRSHGPVPVPHLPYGHSYVELSVPLAALSPGGGTDRGPDAAPLIHPDEYWRPQLPNTPTRSLAVQSRGEDPSPGGRVRHEPPELLVEPLPHTEQGAAAGGRGDSLPEHRQLLAIGEYHLAPLSWFTNQLTERIPCLLIADLLPQDARQNGQAGPAQAVHPQWSHEPHHLEWSGSQHCIDGLQTVPSVCRVLDVALRGKRHLPADHRSLHQTLQGSQLLRQA